MLTHLYSHMLTHLYSHMLTYTYTDTRSHTLSVVPTRAIDEMLEMMGAHTGMDSFIGHKREE